MARWTYDEMRRREDIMNDIRRENDRVIDRLKYGDNYISREDELKYSKQRCLVKQILLNAKIAKSNFWLIVKKIYFDNILGFGVIFLISALIELKSIVTLAFAILLIYNIVKEVIKVIKEFKNIDYIKKTECYQKILEEIKKEEINQIKTIAVSFDSVYISRDNDSSKLYEFKNYNFPRLPFEKQGYLLGSLLKDLHVSKNYSLEVNEGYSLKGITHFQPENIGDCNTFGDIYYRAYIFATNDTLINKQRKEAEQKKKKQQKEYEEKVKSGNTW